MQMNKKGKLQPLAIVLIVIAVVLIVKSGALDGMLSSIGTKASTTTTTVATTTSDTAPSLRDTTTLTVHTRNFYVKSTSLAESGVRVLIDNGALTDKGTLANDGSTTVSPSNKLIVYGGENSSAYYTKKESLTVPDIGTKELTFELKQMDTSPTFTFWNDAGTANTVQALGANEVKTLDIRLRANSQKCFGNPDTKGNNVMCFKYNTTTYNKVYLNGATQAAVPQNVSNKFSETTTAISCYNFAPICDNSDLNGKVVIETASTQPTGNTYINITADDVDYDLDADNLAEIIGVEDEDHNNLGLGTMVLGNILVS